MEWLKWILLAACLEVIAGSHNFKPDRELTNYAFDLYKDTYHKEYRRGEECKRKRIFSRAISRVVTHNLEFDLGRRKYRRGLNKYSDLTNEEFKSTLNGFLGTPESRENRPRRRRMRPLVFSGPNMPKRLDYRDQNLVTPIKDQGTCGSCYAFSAVGALESQLLRSRNRTTDLSEQNLVDCSSKHGNLGCQGGLMTQAFDYIIDNDGINTENAYPYKAQEGRCKFKKSNVGATISDYDEVNDGEERELREVLVNFGPISVGMDASLQSFQDYKGGVYDDSDCSSRKLDHAVLLVGYGTEDGVDYWTIKNSYGTSWGENGYGRIQRNRNNLCGLATQFSYPII